MEIMRKIKKAYLGLSVLCVVLGGFMVITPTAVNDVVCYVFGGVAIVYAIIRIIGYFLSKEERGVYRDSFSGASAALLMGIFIIVKPDLVSAIIPFICGIIFIVNGISNVQYAFDLKKFTYKRWWTVLLTALIVIGAGSLIVFNPFETSKLITAIIGATLILTGLSNIWCFICVHRKIKNIKKNSDIMILDENS